MKKSLIILSIFLLVLSSISISSAARDEASDVAELTVWFGRNDFIPGDKFETFHQQNPNIKVTYEMVRLEEAPSDFMRNWEAGTEPDIIHIWADARALMSNGGYLMDMTPYFEQWKQEAPDHYNSLIPAAFSEAATANGIHGVTAHLAASWHVFRIDWMEEAGITEIPETWDEVIDAAITLRDSGLLSGSQYPYSLPLADNVATHILANAMFMAMGGQHRDDGTPIVDSESGRALVEFYQTLAKEELVNPDVLAWGSNECRGAFAGGNVGMFRMGENVFPAFVEAGLDYGENWIATPLPYRTGAKDEYRLIGSSFPYVVSARTEHPEAALKVLQYLTTPEINREVAVRYQPSTNIEVATHPDLVAGRPWVEDLYEDWLNHSPQPVHASQPSVNDEWIRMLQRAFTNPSLDPEEITKRSQEVMDKL